MPAADREMDDERLRALLARARAGDRDAFFELAQALRSRIKGVGWIAPHVQAQLDGSDVAQEVLLRVWAALPELKSGGIPQFLAFVRTTARHVFMDTRERAEADCRDARRQGEELPELFSDEDADPVDVRAFGFDPARPLLLCAGLLYAAKGQDLLLEALAKPENAAWQCAFAGSGDDAHALAARANLLGLEDRVQWLGFRRDLPAWMAACDALALPSRWEGMPYVVLEAFAAGKPVVATPVAGARALVRADCGWLAASIDSEALAAALAACGSAGSEGRATRGARAQELVRADYGLERMIDRHVDLYRSVA